MRALVLADTNPVGLKQILLDEQPDLVLTLGDLNQLFLNALKEFPRPVIGVYGNHCDGVYLKRIGGIDLHRATAKYKGVMFGGLGGCVIYKANGWQQYTQPQAARWMRRMPQVDVFICHCPPAGINDNAEDQAHRGWDGLLDYIQERPPPQILLHGHTHPAANEIITEFAGVQIEYVYGHRIVELPDSSIC